MGAIESVSTKLAVNSAHAASTAIYYSLQCRADFLLETHLPSLTRDLAVAKDGALRGAYTTAFGFDILNPDGQFSGKRDPTFLRDLAGPKARAGGCGYSSTERREVFLNTPNNVLPRVIGDNTSTNPGCGHHSQLFSARARSRKETKQRDGKPSSPREACGPRNSSRR